MGEGYSRCCNADDSTNAKLNVTGDAMAEMDFDDSRLVASLAVPLLKVSMNSCPTVSQEPVLVAVPSRPCHKPSGMHAHVSNLAEAMGNDQEASRHQHGSLESEAGKLGTDCGHENSFVSTAPSEVSKCNLSMDTSSMEASSHSELALDLGTRAPSKENTGNSQGTLNRISSCSSVRSSSTPRKRRAYC
mmetsp:Transcript_9138/g.14750  ORF Transcript_9138/g.14750 Transcript_9138/m.14750 type:complete len:189 (+) Transcript_9138:74-640(+)